VDCLIAGGGLMGASIAWRLAQRGARVTVLEAKRFYGEASWAGAGMLSPHGERFPSPVWQARAVESLALYPEFVRELAAASGDPIDYAVCGAVELTAEGEQRFPEEAMVNPRDLGEALRTVLKDLGVRVRAYQPAARVERRGARWGMGEFEADAVVIAAGAWSSRIAVEGEPPLPESNAVKGYLLGYQMPAGSLGEIRREGHTYVVQRSDGFTIAGSTEEPGVWDDAVDPAVVRELRERAGRLWTALDGKAPGRVWTGLRPSTTSGDIYVEEWRERLWLAYGHFRNGILLAPWTAQHVANHLLPQ